MIFPTPVRAWIYRIVAVASLALAAGILSPLGQEVSDYVARIIAFGNALVGAGAASLAAKNTPRHEPDEPADGDRGAVSLMTVLIVLGIIVLSIIILRWVSIDVR